MNYEEWNRAIINYFTAGGSSGSQVYLSVDEDVLEELGRESNQSLPIIGWTADFQNAVRSDCVSGQEVQLKSHHFEMINGIPGCVTFLAAMVLAATYMAEEVGSETVAAEHNYFTRLREVLGLSLDDRGRPRGFPAARQEALWWLWKRFLVQNNLVPTAERGRSVASRYIQYPISQALLRHGDMARLIQIFRQERASHRLPKFCDFTGMSRWFRRYMFGSSHLRELAHDKDPRRSQAAVEALLELYNSIDFSNAGSAPAAVPGSVVVRRLIAGWYRIADLLTGDISYLLYPRQPRRGVAQTLEIESSSGEWQSLTEERPGRFLPLWEEPLAGGTHYKLRGDPRWSEVIVPEASFRVFVRNPDDPASNVFADWRSPGVGETFLFTCKNRYLKELAVLRQQKVIDWNGDPVALRTPNVNWFEIRDCMVLARQWETNTPEGEELAEVLRPRVSASISFSGGLRAPVAYRWVWLAGYLGNITVAAFEEYVRLKVTDVAAPAHPVFDEIIGSEETVALRDLTQLSAGHYLTEALVSGRTADQKPFEVLAWEDLRGRQSETDPIVTKLGEVRVCGALIEKDGQVDQA
jgi:hypothetical protein